MCYFGHVSMLPLPEHRPGFIVHATVGDAAGTGKPGKHNTAPYHAV
ncbi:hypothetical protein, unknown function [Leishmania tarentolae]|uniref:Uncharacterized protein n=1 Tax=Leishmania tarentolae TaxID=5689 RepID=A0A640KLY4_LEITA|nr:hypothetical protein, unknown function [Leishmania tarentolae]